MYSFREVNKGERCINIWNSPGSFFFINKNMNAQYFFVKKKLCVKGVSRRYICLSVLFASEQNLQSIYSFVCVLFIVGGRGLEWKCDSLRLSRIPKCVFSSLILLSSSSCVYHVTILELILVNFGLFFLSFKHSSLLVFLLSLADYQSKYYFLFSFS